MTNHRTLTTGAFFVRNSVRGRAFMRDWLAVVMSGMVTCYAFDQAALQVLFFLRQLPESAWTHTPFGFDCMPRDVEVAAWGRHGTGCSHSTWGQDISGGVTGTHSCDVAFERKLRELGFKTAVPEAKNTNRTEAFAAEVAPTSIMRGCANAHIADFHIATETKTRPRLYCTFCGRVDQVVSNAASVVGFGLGGGNDLLHQVRAIMTPT